MGGGIEARWQNGLSEGEGDKYRVLQKKGYYFGWSLFGENLNSKLNMRDIYSQ